MLFFIYLILFCLFFFFTIFGSLFLQILEEVLPELWAKDSHHLVLAQLAESGSIHSAMVQTQGTRIKLCALHLVTDPLQDVVWRPAVGADLPVPLSCRERGPGVT